MTVGHQALRDHDLKKAEACYSAALRQATPYGEQDPRYAESLHALALIYELEDRFDASKRLYSAELRILQRLDVDYSSQGMALNELAKMERGVGHLDAALHYYSQAVIAYGKEPVKFGWEIAMCQGGAGDCYKNKHEYAKAETMLEQAISFWQKSTVVGHEAYMGVCLITLGEVHSLEGRYTDAESTYKRDLRNLENLGPCPDKLVATAACMEGMAQNYRLAAKYDVAIATFKQAFSGWENAERPPEEARCLMELGETYKLCGKYSDAALSFKKAISLLETIDRQYHNESANLILCKQMLATLDKANSNERTNTIHVQTNHGPGTEQ